MGLLFGCSTAVAVLSLISFAFLVIATITPPAVKSFGLSRAEDLIYGALGYCSTETSECVTGTPAYKVSELTSLTDWKMDSNARDTLAKILIVIPVAAFLTLISFLFNFFGHFKVFGRSTAFYIVGFVVALLAFFASAIAVIVTFLLFYPHVQWPAWLLIPAAIFNLVSAPLVFFSLRTTPKAGLDEDEIDEVDEANLTDLTDGFSFQKQSFKLNDIPPGIEKSISTFEKIPPSSLRIVDSASSNDQFEKVSIKDYPRTHNNNNNVPTYNGYQGYNLNNSSAEYAGNRAPYSEGTPNLVSSQNYNKGGAVRSEAPVFKPQSAKPDLGTTQTTSSYPQAQYKSKQQFSAAPVNMNTRATEYSQPVSSGVLGHSDHDDSNVVTEPYYDLEDSHSDFTSVSQRAANPHFYNGLNQQGPSLFPEQQPLPVQQQPIQGQGFPPSQGGYFVPQNSGGQQYLGNSAGVQQSQRQAHDNHPPARDTSDVLLSANPDFAVSGPAFQKKTFTKNANPMQPGGYRPAYKRRQSGSSNRMPAASLSADSPYNFR